MVLLRGSARAVGRSRGRGSVVVASSVRAALAPVTRPRRAVLILLLGVLSACAGPSQGVVTGRALDRDHPLLVMRADDGLLEDGSEVERSGAVLTGLLRQRLAVLGFEAVAGQGRTLDAALDEARELRCGSVVTLDITDWADSKHDWVAHPDRLGLAITFWSVEDGLPVAYGTELAELTNMNVVRQSPFDLAPPLLERLLDAILAGSIDASDVPGS